MCGIVGYIGNKNTQSVLVEGLKKLEYRGYDSAGIAVFTPEGLQITKALGRLANLEAKLDGAPLVGNAGIGHTRWATHGACSVPRCTPRDSVPARMAAGTLPPSGLSDLE